jgi:hypothetical protein
MIRTILKVAATVAIVAIATSCATTRRVRTVETAGFLGDYSQLKPGQGDQAQLVYIKQGIDLRPYNKIIIDPITIMGQSGSEINELSKEQIQHLGDSLYLALQKELSQDYQIVKQPSPGTLRLRPAITDARGSKVGMDVITTVIPQAALLSKLTGAVTDSAVFVGRAGVEAELLDAQSGERLMAGVDERVGGKALRGLTNTWGDVEQAHQYWAERLRKQMALLKEASAQEASK